MVLGFMTRWGKPARPTGFEEKILDGRKKHTLRRDENGRWQKDRVIQFVVGNRTKQRRQFMEGTCTGVQRVELRFGFLKGIWIYVDGKPLTTYEDKNLFAYNDGFETYEDFDRWFRPYINTAAKEGHSLQLKLIHWTELTY